MSKNLWFLLQQYYDFWCVISEWGCLPISPIAKCKGDKKLFFK